MLPAFRVFSLFCLFRLRSAVFQPQKTAPQRLFAPAPFPANRKWTCLSGCFEFLCVLLPTMKNRPAVKSSGANNGSVYRPCSTSVPSRRWKCSSRGWRWWTRSWDRLRNCEPSTSTRPSLSRPLILTTFHCQHRPSTRPEEDRPEEDMRLVTGHQTDTNTSQQAREACANLLYR